MHFLVFKLGGMGDILMALPALRGLRNSFPAARISFVIGRSNQAVLAGCPHVDQVVTVDDRAIFQGGPVDRIRETLRLLADVRNLKPDVAFVLHRDWRWNLVFSLAGVPRRLGFARDWDGAFLTRAVATDPRQHEILKYQLLFGQEPGYRPDGDGMELFPSPEDQAAVESLMAGWPDRPLLALAPGGAANVKENRELARWPLDRYGELVRRILRETPATVVLVGGPGDRPLTGELRIDSRVFDLAGELAIQRTYLLLKLCRLLVAHDGGPMHLGAAAGIPVVSLFGPTRPLEKAPITHPASRWLWTGSDLSCVPCYRDGYFPDCQHRDCLRRIGVDEVMIHVHQAWTGEPAGKTSGPSEAHGD